MDDLHQYVQEVLARPGKPIEPLPEVKPYEAFVYQAFELRDPFTVGGEDQAPAEAADKGKEAQGIRPDFSRPKEVLEAFPLDSLRMVGSMEVSGRLWALLRDPTGAVHRVIPGNYLGQNHGRVTRVQETRIDVTEIVPDGLGGWMERQASVALTE